MLLPNPPYMTDHVVQNRERVRFFGARYRALLCRAPFIVYPTTSGLVWFATAEQVVSTIEELQTQIARKFDRDEVWRPSGPALATGYLTRTELLFVYLGDEDPEQLVVRTFAHEARQDAHAGIFANATVVAPDRSNLGKVWALIRKYGYTPMFAWRGEEPDSGQSEATA